MVKRNISFLGVLYVIVCIILRFPLLTGIAYPTTTATNGQVRSTIVDQQASPTTNYFPSYGFGSPQTPSFGSSSTSFGQPSFDHFVPPNYGSNVNYGSTPPQNLIQNSYRTSFEPVASTGYDSGLGYPDPGASIVVDNQTPLPAAAGLDPYGHPFNGAVGGYGRKSGPEVYDRRTKCHDVGSIVEADQCCSATTGFIDNSGNEKCCYVQGSSCSSSPNSCCNGQVCAEIGTIGSGVFICIERGGVSEQLVPYIDNERYQNGRLSGQSSDGFNQQLNPNLFNGQSGNQLIGNQNGGQFTDQIVTKLDQTEDIFNRKLESGGPFGDDLGTDVDGAEDEINGELNDF